MDPAPSGRRLRIGIDAHAIGARLTGNERFASNLIPALRRVCDHDLLVYVSKDVGLWTAPDGVRTRSIPVSHPLLRIPFVLPSLARRDRIDVLLVQYTGPPVSPCPVVTVVHDVAFALFPSFYRPSERLWMRRTIPASMRRAAGVVTVSEFSKREIQRVYGIPAERITVALDGIDPVFTDPVPRPSLVEPPFFLTVGNQQPRKNLLTLISAYRILVERYPDIPERLVVVGQEWAHREARTLRAEAGDLVREGRVTFTGYVEDKLLVGLLRRATAFAYPSVYEGFGLPPVEAMAAGAPALVGDIPVMREVVADAALRLPPNDPAAWAEGLHRVASDSSFRQSLVEGGRVRASRYSWDHTARQVLSALQSAAGATMPRR
jgi:glycosyltransferase involved in cell wall biosynthesis